MKSKNIDKSIDKTAKNDEIHSKPDIPVSAKMAEQTKDDNEQSIAISGLTLMLERLVAYFQPRAALDDRETLVFCLHHLFHHVDGLYCETLPVLATVTHTRATSLVTPSAYKTHIGFRYTLWTRLQEMQQHIERVKSLCHLLNRTVPRLLCILDMPGESQNDQHKAIPVHHSHGSMYPEDDTERWQQAYELLTARLSTWQERNGERLSFADDTTQYPNNITSTSSVAINPSSSAIRPPLLRIDATLMLVLDSAGAIFGDIVPDFQVVARGDDEVVATLLFDLMQQADLLLIQCDALFGPMQDLIRHYMLFE